MRPRTPSLDWIAKVLGESAEDRPRRSRPVLRLVSSASAPDKEITRRSAVAAAPMARVDRGPKPIAGTSSQD
jgi:hypothetical protein